VTTSPTISVFGVDPSTKRIGLARPDGTTVSLRARAGAEDPIRRRHELRTAVRRELRCWPEATLLVVEGYALGAVPGRLALVRLGEIGGAVRDEAFEAGLDVVEISPAALKVEATGNGRASKAEVVAAAVAAGASPRNDDEADAWWLSEIGRRALAGAPLSPKVAALSWPSPTTGRTST
jgi:hypothetical protein